VNEPLEITLDLPNSGLSPNARKHWRAKSKLVKEYREHACEQAMSAAYDQKVERPFETPVVLIKYWNRRKVRPDGDNIIASMKSAFDGFEDAGLFTNDRFCFYFPVWRLVDRKNPRVDVTIYSSIPNNVGEILNDMIFSDSIT